MLQTVRPYGNDKSCATIFRNDEIISSIGDCSIKNLQEIPSQQ